MRLLMFYVALVAPLVVLVLFSKHMPMVWFIAGLFAYVPYNLLLTNRKLKRKGYNVGIFAHLNPFSKRSMQLYDKVYFEV
jgi:hypothetical protein